MHSVNEIRSAFLNYFQKNGHEVVASSPLVPRNDPTLMFTAAGMVQFKNVFTGAEQRPYKRAVTAQRCVRAGGKHNDLDNVGYTARHLTFFEMLGNFSFGDYFKEEAISLAWNLLTKEFDIPREKLLVTVYHTDEVAANLWRKIAGLPDDKIIRIASSDNFWEMGDTGPCGPCSEIFFDHGEGVWGGPPGSKDEDGDRFIEIWNLVFMQYEQVNSEDRIDLPCPSIDTGMGLERLTAVLQGVHDNYDIDLFRTLIAASEEATGVKAVGEFMASHRVIADHLRSSAFLISDGVLPSNEGRGYVLRRIMRRAMRHAGLLGVKEPLLWRLLPPLVREMGEAYPELVRAQALISETLKLEEVRFRKTLDRGLLLLNEATANLKKGDQLTGQVAFKLYDTYGFPLDLTQDALRRRDISVDVAGFDVAMAKQKAEARAHWAGSGEAITESLWLDLRDKAGLSEFLGYDTEQAEGVVIAFIQEGKEVDKLYQGQEAGLVVNQTPFYAESGGQIGDTGLITVADSLFEVLDTQKKADGVIVHNGVLKSGQLKLGDAVHLQVDGARRRKIRANHSATHLLHKALRHVLGDHVVQKGSLVSAERLRFDFSHPQAMSAKELEQVEALVNHMIRQNSAVKTRLMAADEAIAIGAMALFGEKYGDEVRVVSMGEAAGDQEKSTGLRPWSVELCGGIHVRRTGDIGILRFISESAVASGVRRIEALTGQAAYDYLVAQDQQVIEISQLLKITPQNIQSRLRSLLDERRRLEKELIDLRKKLALQVDGIKSPIQMVETINTISFTGRIVSGVPPRDLKSLVDAGKKQLGSGIVAFISVGDDDKASAVVGVSEDLTAQWSAVDLVRLLSNTLGGQGGGGRPDMAQAGGPYGAKAEAALAVLRSHLKDRETAL
ncbi:alanine--tRNA ligase [Bartonella sp. DGB2]|uniref:alanine--tRNA ligase n=1 Tax=Bartonella sp. DGB2 TaxID=3388426 RepID=UPI00399038D8